MTTGREPRPGDAYASQAERLVGRLLEHSLRNTDRMWPNQRVTDHRKTAEIDFFIGLADAGFVVLEVKGGQISYDGQIWMQTGQNGRSKRVDPIRQAREGMFSLRDYILNDARWGSRGRVRWAHAMIFPFTDVPADFAVPECPRYMVFGRGDLDDLRGSLAEIATRQEGTARVPTQEDILIVEEILKGRGFPQVNLLSEADERDALSDHLTKQQGLLLDFARLVRRMEVRGGAGTGKTWLAMEQARRLQRQGQRVALVCYSRGLAACFMRISAGWPYRERPAYVGTFHGLGNDYWDVPESEAGDIDSDYWERRLPTDMVQSALHAPVSRRFDAIVVDEAQDFADSWWPAVLAALKNERTGRLSIFVDEGQRVFSRVGSVPECEAIFVLDQNLRNTRQIADTFQSLAPIRMKSRGGVGPATRLVPCSPDTAVAVADDVVDDLLESGWRPEDIALLTTGPRHPEQVSRQEAGQDDYWASFWDKEQVFYGQVLGFKGLERRVVVLAVNDSEPRDRAKERLYVGLSRPRDELLVCADPAYIEQVGGHELYRKLTQDQPDS